MPTSVAIERFCTICARTAVPTLVCASAEPLGITACGVMETVLFGVKLTAAAAIAIEAGEVRDGATGICWNNTVNGAPPLVVRLTPTYRRGQRRAGQRAAAKDSRQPLISDTRAD